MTDESAKDSIIRHLERELKEAQMTLLDKFAMAAMQTLIRCVFEHHGDSNYIIDDHDDGRVSLHLRSYEHAAEMMRVRKL